jgi:hypothetical protein
MTKLKQVKIYPGKLGNYILALSTILGVTPTQYVKAAVREKVAKDFNEMGGPTSTPELARAKGLELQERLDILEADRFPIGVKQSSEEYWTPVLIL